MARCQSVEVFPEMVLNGAEILVMESSDSESESDGSRNTDVDIDGENDENDTEVLIMENSDSESESDVTKSTNLDSDGKKDDNDAEIIIMESSDSESESNGSKNKNVEIDDNYNSPENVNNEKLHVNFGPVLSLQCLHDNNIDEDPHTPFKIVAVNGSSGVMGSEVSKLQSSIPARNNWEGAHNFKIEFQCNEMPRKSESTIFSESQQKLYVAKDHPFKVLVYAENVPSHSMIKVTAVFAMVEWSYEIVKRCPTHSQADFAKGNPAYDHFVQCYSEAAVYTKNPDCGKLSVSVPYEKPKEGETFTTYLFKLTCFSSCSGGINRRPFMLVFNLEKDNIPLGRQTVEAKVCACPLRDFKVDQEKNHRKKPRIEPAIKSTSEEGQVDSKYTISVKDPELYLFLKQMKCLYEMSAYSKIKPDT